MQIRKRKEEIPMAHIVEQYIELAKKRNPGEPEFHQTVEEVLESGIQFPFIIKFL